MKLKLKQMLKPPKLKRKLMKQQPKLRPMLKPPNRKEKMMPPLQRRQDMML